MRILANQNIARPVVRELRKLGHDVLAAGEAMAGFPDTAILERAVEEKRLLITHDKDFGELAFRSHLPAECGVVLFRLRVQDRDSAYRRMLEAFQSRDDWSGCFAVVTDTRVRVRPMPHARSDL